MSESETLTSDLSKSGEPLPTPAEFSSTTTSAMADAISFNIWPPTNRTRDAVLRRLVETLTTDSVLCKRYGTVPAGEAEETARGIEQDAFAAAQAEHEAKLGSSGSGSSSVEEGIEILQVYSREVSRRMLEFCKSRVEKVTAAVAAAPASASAEVGTE